jgi:putative DNA primase/helicase
MSVQDTIGDFIAFMRSEGVEPANPADIFEKITCGRVIRFDCAGERKHSKNGWAKLYLDERPAGAFGNWKQGINRRWASGAANELTPQERQHLREEWDRKKAERDAIQREAHECAGRDAAWIWGNAEPAEAGHGYAVSKRLNVAPLRQSGSKLLVPMFDADGGLWNVQRIWPDGTKRYLKDARVDGLFAIIGDFDGARRAIIGEGYATMDAVHQATGLPCVVSFNTSNLPKVARIWSSLRPDMTLTIFADDDAATAEKNLAERGAYKNPGIEAAEAIATEIGAKVAYPPRRAA